MPTLSGAPEINLLLASFLLTDSVRWVISLSILELFPNVQMLIKRIKIHYTDHESYAVAIRSSVLIS